MAGGTPRAAAFLVAALSALSAVPQNEEDALRIGTLAPGGTARSTGVGNAFGALGADPACISINPGAFGLYRGSELSLTPAYEVNGAEATHYGTRVSDARSRFHFGNFALVLNSPADKEGAWRGATYGVVYDRLASHHWSRTAVGDRVPSTILQEFADVAEGTSRANLATAFPFTANLAWETYAINPLDTVVHTYASAIPFGSDTRQTHTMESRGASTNTAFFYSGNYKDRLYPGIALGIAGHRFRRTMAHSETTLDDTLALKDVTFEEELSTTGNGFEVKVGLVARATDRFRLGIAFHSPQWLRLADVYAMSMRTTFRTPDANGQYDYTAGSPEGSFAYRVHTPWRTVLSAAYIAGSNGLVSVDYEYADFRRARFRSGDRLIGSYDFARENSAIQGSFRAVHNLRAGTEWRMGPWYYRLGVGYASDPYVDNDPRQGTALMTYAAGIGYRGEHFSVDLGLAHTRKDTRYFQYARYLVEPTLEQQRTYRALLTLAFRA